MIIDVKVSNANIGGRHEMADTFEYEFTFDEGKIRSLYETRRWGTSQTEFLYKTELYVRYYY